MEEKIREPRQQRAIEKKNRIIQAGYELFAKKGYYNTNTAEIARAAHVSTGVLYDYFGDKKDIFMLCLKKYADDILAPVYQRIEETLHSKSLHEVLSAAIDVLIEMHTMDVDVHDEMITMSLYDEDVKRLYCDMEKEVTYIMQEIFISKGCPQTHVTEKAHIAYNLIENLCHELTYHKHDFLDGEVMKDEVIKLILKLFPEQKEPLCDTD